MFKSCSTVWVAARLSVDTVTFLQWESTGAQTLWRSQSTFGMTLSDTAEQLVYGPVALYSAGLHTQPFGEMKSAVYVKIAEQGLYILERGVWKLAASLYSQTDVMPWASKQWTAPGVEADSPANPGWKFTGYLIPARSLYAETHGDMTVTPALMLLFSQEDGGYETVQGLLLEQSGVVDRLYGAVESPCNAVVIETGWCGQGNRLVGGVIGGLYSWWGDPYWLWWHDVNADLVPLCSEWGDPHGQGFSVVRTLPTPEYSTFAPSQEGFCY